MNDFLNLFNTNLLASTLRLVTPILLAALEAPVPAGGVFNIAWRARC